MLYPDGLLCFYIQAENKMKYSASAFYFEKAARVALGVGLHSKCISSSLKLVFWG